jgi:hypothetical protein
MNFNIKWIDVNPHLQIQQQPIFLLERALLHGDKVKGNLFNVAEVARTGNYWTATSPIHPEQVVWGNTVYGQHVRIPVFAYKTTQKAIVSLAGTGIQHGLAAYHNLAPELHSRVEECIMVLGHECHEVDDAYRFYLGLSFRVKDL